MASQGPLLAAADALTSTMPSLTGGGVMSTLVSVAHASTSKEASSSPSSSSSSTLSRWSFLEWRRRSTVPAQKTTPWFIPAEMMREEELGEGGGGGATAAAIQEEEGGEHEAPIKMSFSMTEEEEITTTTTTRFGSSMQDLSSSSSSCSGEMADELLDTAKEAIADVQAIVDEAEAQIEADETAEEEAYAAAAATAAAAAETAARSAAPPRPSPTPRTSFLKPRARHAAATKCRNADDEDSIPCGRSLSSALSVIGGGLPLRRGGSTMGAAITSSSSSSSSTSFPPPAARSVLSTHFSTASTMTKVYHAEEEVVQEAREGGATWAQTVAEEEISISLTTASSSTLSSSSTSPSQDAAVAIEATVRAVEGQAHAVAAAAAAAAVGTNLDEEVTREAELAERFHAQTAKQVAGLTSEQRGSLERVREVLYGPEVCEKRVRAVDELVVCGDRDAMMLSFLQRKNYDAEVVLKSFERVITWRMENGIEDVFQEGRLAREKVEKHRECWPTAFYFRKDKEEGDPVFVDRMGILELAKLRKGEVQLDMQDMVLYYIQTMEGRRR